MNTGNDEQRWRNSNQQRGQGGQRRNMPRDGTYSGQGYGQNNTSNGNTNAWGGGRNMNHHHQQQQQQQQANNAAYYDPHVSVNGFNPHEALEMLTRGYDFQIQAARAPGGPDGDKPIIYRGDKGWSTPKGSNNAWGQKRNAMASGNDFLVQLKKSHMACMQSGEGRE